jgi:hypothetical protein
MSDKVSLSEASQTLEETSTTDKFVQHLGK